MKCVSCGFQLKVTKTCSSCGHDNHGVIADTESHSLSQAEMAEEHSLLKSRFASLLRMSLFMLFGIVMFSLDNAIIALIGGLMMVISSLAYSVILFKLEIVESNYKKAGFFYVVNMLLVGISLFGISIEPLFGILGVLFPLLASNFEFHSHSYVLSGVDKKLSKAWIVFWKLMLLAYIGSIAGVLLLIFSPAIGVIVFLVSGLTLVILNIVKLVLLSKSATAFARPY